MLLMDHKSYSRYRWNKTEIILKHCRRDGKFLTWLIIKESYVILKTALVRLLQLSGIAISLRIGKERKGKSERNFI